MSLLAFAAVAGFGLASFALGAVLYYRLGQRAVAKAIAGERKVASLLAAFKQSTHDKVVSDLNKAHSEVSAKLAAVKAEIEGIEKSGYADVTSAVQRIKKLF